MELFDTKCLYTIASDMERAVAFYEGLFSRGPAFRDGDRWSQYKIGTSNFALSSPEESAVGLRGSIVVFAVDDLAGARRNVESLGGRHTGIRDMGRHGKVGTFHDPDGNLFQLFEPFQPAQVGEIPTSSADEGK